MWTWGVTRRVALPRDMDAMTFVPPLAWRRFRPAVGLLTLGLLVLGLHPTHALVGREAPGVTSPAWINSHPLGVDALRGKVVLVEFWTFGCYNCRNVEPKIKEWHQRYAKQGLVVIGVHSPEFAYEKNVDAVKEYIQDHGITYPVAVDNDFVNWRRFGNRYWPCIYLVDKRGVIRHIRAGEGGYVKTEAVIRALLNE